MRWKQLAFDRRSRERKEAILNLVETHVQTDCYFTTVFDVRERAFQKLAERELGASRGGSAGRVGTCARA